MPGASRSDDPELRRQVVALMARRTAERAAPRRLPELSVPAPAKGRLHEIRKKLSTQVK